MWVGVSRAVAWEPLGFPITGFSILSFIQYALMETGLGLKIIEGMCSLSVISLHILTLKIVRLIDKYT